MQKPSPPLLCQSEQSQLVLIDLQTKLCAAMPAAAMARTEKNAGILLQAATMLEVPVLLTEQYPQGLGGTLPALLQLTAVSPVHKMAFSAYHAPKFKARLSQDKPQIVLAGMEAHICLLQTALHLLAQGRQVFVVEDAIISRNPDNQVNAVNRLKSAGCIITNTESVVFEWLGHAEHPAFKAISRLIK